MRMTERAMAEFSTELEPADLPCRVGQERPAALPPGVLHSLLRFEGALAWEGGAPRTDVPSPTGWAQEVWLAGWDDMYARYGARER